MNHTDLFQLNLLDSTKRNIIQENSRRVLEKSFLELDLTDTSVSLVKSADIDEGLEMAALNTAA
jgi:hypothetical protein